MTVPGKLRNLIYDIERSDFIKRTTRTILVTGVSNGMVEGQTWKGQPVLPAMPPVFSFKFLCDTNTCGDHNDQESETICNSCNIFFQYSI